MITGLHHGETTVKNLESSIEFYEKIGLKLVKIFEQSVNIEGGLKDVKMRMAFFKAGNETFELIEYSKPKGVKYSDLNPWDIGSQHIAFEVKEIRKFYNKFKNEIVFLSPPIDYKSGDIDATWTYLKDPDGGIIELVESHKTR